jgi:hypothetical protein
MDEVEHSRSHAHHAATEMNFGLREKYAEMYFGTLQFSQKGERSAGSERRALRQARTRVNASANAQYPCPFARSASPRASDQLTRKRGDAKAERGRRAYVGRDCIRRRKQAPCDPGTRWFRTARADGRNHCLSRHQSGHGMPCPNTPTPTIIAYRIISGRCTRFVAGVSGATRATATKSA